MTLKLNPVATLVRQPNKTIVCETIYCEITLSHYFILISMIEPLAQEEKITRKVIFLYFVIKLNIKAYSFNFSCVMKKQSTSLYINIFDCAAGTE